MTRVRVLLKAKKLLLDGFIPYGQIRGDAMNDTGAVVSYMHPKACRFTLFGAINRAVLDTTGDDFRKREKLTDAAYDPLIRRLGSYQGLRTVATGPVEEIIKVIDDQLRAWNENV